MQEMIALARSFLFTNAVEMNLSALVFRKEVRDMCAANRCGKYDACWTCPPACGELDALRERAKGFRSGVLLQTTGKLEDSFDYEGMQDAANRHAASFEAFLKELLARFGTGAFWPMGAGGCKRCDKCAYPDAPCRFPELSAPSMEACGLVVSDVCTACGVPYKYSDDTITYVSCVLFRDEHPKCAREMLEIASDTARAVVDPLGAQLISLKGADGAERMWCADPAVWGESAPVLFPVAGGFKDDYYTLRGKQYCMPKHGFAKRCLFALEEKTASSATFVLSRPHPGFPFAYAFRVRFTLCGNDLRVDYITDNRGEDTLYFGMGAHEGFACPGGIDKYRIVFDAPETLKASLLVGSQIAHETETLLERGRELFLKREYFIPDALVFLDLETRACTLLSEDGARGVRVEYEGFDSLLLWQKPGAPYLCIEPWCNAPEFVDHDHDITRKPGVIALAPGARDTRTHTIRLL